MSLSKNVVHVIHSLRKEEGCYTLNVTAAFWRIGSTFERLVKLCRNGLRRSQFHPFIRVLNASSLRKNYIFSSLQSTRDILVQMIFVQLGAKNRSAKIEFFAVRLVDYYLLVPRFGVSDWENACFTGLVHTFLYCDQPVWMVERYSA